MIISCKDHFNERIKITSVPGGVGLLTRLALLENCIEASKRNFNFNGNEKIFHIGEYNRNVF